MSDKPRDPMVEIEGTIYVVPPTVARYIEEQDDAWERAEAHANYLASELRWYMGLHDRGELPDPSDGMIYRSFQQALAATGRAEVPEGPRDDTRGYTHTAAFGIGVLIGAAIIVVFGAIGMVVQA